MDVLIERCAGLDVHKRTVVATIRTPGLAGKRRSQTQSFATTAAGLEALSTWLTAAAVSHVAMESTGVYWRRGALQEAVRGGLRAHHAFLMQQQLKTIDHLAEQIAALDAQIAQTLTPIAHVHALLRSVPGVATRAADAILAEIGTDMTRSPPLAIWHRGPASVPARTRARANGTPPPPARRTTGCVPR